MRLSNLALKILHLTCKDTSPLISEMMDHELPLCARWRVKFHLAICKFCMYYKDQLETITVLAKEMAREDSSVNQGVVLAPETKEKIKKLIEAKE